MLPDGDHDAIVVDASDDGDAVVLTVALVAGEHKGEVIDVRATGLDREPLDLLAEPCTLHVHDGRPALTFD